MNLFVLLVFIKISQVYLYADKVVNLDLIGRKGEHILHNNRITVARSKIIVLYKFERERRKSYIWRFLSFIHH